MVLRYVYICQTCGSSSTIEFDTEKRGRRPTYEDLPDDIPCGWQGCEGRRLNIYQKE